MPVALVHQALTVIKSIAFVVAAAAVVAAFTTTTTVANFTTTTTAATARTGAVGAAEATLVTATTSVATATAFTTTTTIATTAAATAAVTTAATAVAAFTTATAEATTAAAAAEAGRTWFHGACFVHDHIAATQCLTIHTLNGSLRLSVAGHLYKAEAFGPTRVALHHDFSAGHCTKLPKGLFQIAVAHRVRQVSDVQFITP